MSTKRTALIGKGFHLYSDCRDPGAIFLELEGEESAIRIPIPVWETIREHTETDGILSLVDMSDEALEIMAIHSVDSRLASYQRGNKLAAIQGQAYYGDIEAPRRQQIKKSVEVLKARRAEQVRAKERIEKAKREAEPGGVRPIVFVHEGQEVKFYTMDKSLDKHDVKKILDNGVAPLFPEDEGGEAKYIVSKEDVGWIRKQCLPPRRLQRVLKTLCSLPATIISAMRISFDTVTGRSRRSEK